MVVTLLNFILFFSILQSGQLDYGNIHVITTNDIHGMIGEQKAAFMNPNFPPTIIGGPAYYKYVRDLENEFKNGSEDILTLDGGNFFQGHPFGIVDSGKTMIEWMNKIKYDAMVPGNTDFIFGYKNLVKLSKFADFPFLASNIFYEENDLPVFNPYTIVNINDVSIGIIGVVSASMDDVVLSKNIEGIYFTSEIESIEKSMKELKEKDINIIIVLSSLGIPWNRDRAYSEFLKESNEDNKINNSLELGYYLEGVDLIISGGISKGYSKPWYDKYSHVYAFQNYGNGTEFGHFKIKYSLNENSFQGYEFVSNNRISQTLFIDDFSFDKEQHFWIQNKISESVKKVYSDIDWFTQIDGDKSTGLMDKSQNRILLDLENKNKVVSSRWNVPNIDTEMIDIITWNCEFFPTSGDSTIDALHEVINQLQPDIIAFQEIKKRGWFDKLLKRLPQYDFVISEQSSFMDQAIIYKTDLFDLINRVELFAEDDYNFAGRPPLKCDLIYRPSNKKISLINLHMKCCDSGLSRRKKASKMLHEFLDDKLEEDHSNYIVLGDWNDDLKDNIGEHCFDPFLNDSRFFFPTLDITYDISQATYPKEPYVSFLDHILVTKSIIKNNEYTVKTLPFDEYMGSFEIYEKFISDHMPVLFSFK